MADFSTIGNLSSGGNSAPAARPAPPEPVTVQQAVGQPLGSPQSAVTQSPKTGGAEWQRNADPQANKTQEPTSQTEATRKHLTETIDHLNRRLNDYNTNLQFEIDDKYQQMVIRIVDRETKEVVRQIPSEKALAFAKFFEELEAEQGQGPPGGGSSPSSKESGRLKAEGWLLRATA
ncbi:MAG: flagellar protein FlaG [Candidatus Competibacter sp.]|nr:flagellar protein FlaG [Candidatus Competibacter sp.]